jgi:putative nucleotidyltransferase-like protein
MIRARPSGELALVVDHLAIAADLPITIVARQEAIDWERFLALVDEHQLGPFLASRRPDGAYPRSVEGELEQARIRAGHEALFRSWALDRVLRSLEIDGIRPVLLKGSAIASTLYAEEAEREMSDVDLLFEDVASLERARRWLEGEGYVSSAADAKIHHHAPPLSSPVTELVFELHTNLATPALPEELIRSMLDASVFADGWRVLDPVSRLLHHALHALSDPIDSPLLRNLFETGWMAHLLAENERADFVRIVDRFGLAPGVAPSLFMARELFGTPAILEGPAVDARALWGWRRLGWIGTFEREPLKWRELERSLAAEHFRAIKRGRSARSILPFAGALARIAESALGARARERLRAPPEDQQPLPKLVFPAGVRARAIGDRLLVHEPDTKRVHLLDPLSKAVFECARESPIASRITERLVAEGADRNAVERAIADLLALGLLRETRSG